METRHTLPQLCQRLLCTGCGACFNACPHEALRMEADPEEGFAYPQADAERCVGCGACERACPVLRPVVPADHAERPEVYACWSRDAATRRKSSSGGAFSALAQAVYARGGCVVGAAYDADMTVRQLLTDRVDDLPRLRGSKYVQSDAGLIYRQVQDRLRRGIEVLFVGTPCQVAGLRSFLHRDYPGLVCCDFVCHGTPSPMLFRKYLDWVEKKKGIKVTEFNFRDKRSGWYDALRTANDRCYLRGKFDAYFFGFNGNVSLRESCYRCPAIGLPRRGDLTIADYWGVGRIYRFPGGEVHKGVSLLMINNAKGAALMQLAQPYMHCKHGDLDEALQGNQPMVRPSHRPASRDVFYHWASRLEFGQLRRKFLVPGAKPRLVATMREYAPRPLVIGIRGVAQYLTWLQHGSKTL